MFIIFDKSHNNLSIWDGGSCNYLFSFFVWYKCSCLVYTLLHVVPSRLLTSGYAALSMSCNLWCCKCNTAELCYLDIMIIWHIFFGGFFYLLDRKVQCSHHETQINQYSLFLCVILFFAVIILPKTDLLFVRFISIQWCSFIGYYCCILSLLILLKTFSIPSFLSLVVTVISLSVVILLKTDGITTLNVIEHYSFEAFGPTVIEAV